MDLHMKLIVVNAKCLLFSSNFSIKIAGILAANVTFNQIQKAITVKAIP